MKINELAKWAIKNNCYNAELEVEKYNETYNVGTTTDVYPEIKDLRINTSRAAVIMEV